MFLPIQFYICNAKLFVLPNTNIFLHFYRESFSHKIYLWINFLVMKKVKIPLPITKISTMIEFTFADEIARGDRPKKGQHRFLKAAAGYDWQLKKEK